MCCRAVQKGWQSKGRDGLFLEHNRRAEEWQRNLLGSSEDKRLGLFEGKG